MPWSANTVVLDGFGYRNWRSCLEQLGSHRTAACSQESCLEQLGSHRTAACSQEKGCSNTLMAFFTMTYGEGSTLIIPQKFMRFGRFRLDMFASIYGKPL
jgi:hypothetical protein